MVLYHMSKTIIFIAHLNADKPRIAIYIEYMLQQFDHDVHIWIDRGYPALNEVIRRHNAENRIHHIELGQTWLDCIDNAISSADCVVAFWSREAFAGNHDNFI